MAPFIDFLTYMWSTIGKTLESIIAPAILFAALAFAVKRRASIEAAIRAMPEVRITVLFIVFNAIFVAPFITGASIWLHHLSSGAWTGSTRYLWSLLPSVFVVLIAVFIGDLVGYWRHRIEHTRFLWPSHAIHHSDTEMTWLTLERFHPINRITTFVIDSSALILLGFPAYAIVLNNLVRHYYGYFIHADVPWTYGKLGLILVSPAMHRWHHSDDAAALNTNFATVFSFIDRMFGTYRVPGQCTTSLGAGPDIKQTFTGQFIHPLKRRPYER